MLLNLEQNITVNSDDYIINDGFISGSKTLTINAKDVVNKGGIAVVDLSAEQSKDSVMTINANNLTNYNTIFANADINLNIKNELGMVRLVRLELTRSRITTPSK